MHSDTDRALSRSTDVVSVPGDTHGNVGVDAVKKEMVSK